MGSHRVRHDWSDLAAAAAATWKKKMGKMNLAGGSWEDKALSRMRIFSEENSLNEMQNSLLLTNIIFVHISCYKVCLKAYSG